MPASGFVQILRRRGTARLLVGALTARVPDSIAATSIVVLVRAVTRSYPAAGLAAAAFGVGTAISAPLVGRVIDRLGQRRVLPVLAIAFGSALTLVALTAGWAGRAGVCLLAAVAGLARPPLEAGLRAAWPHLVPDGWLDAAYTLDSSAQELIWIGGPLLLAALLATGSARLPVLACAAFSVGGTAVYATSPCLPGAGSRATSRKRGPLGSARLRILLVAAASYGIAVGLLNLALVAYASTHGGVSWAGVLVAVWGVASLAGGVAYGSRTWRTPVEWRALGCLALFGCALMLLAAAPSLPILALLMIPLGIPLSPWLGSLSTSAQRAISATSATETFSWIFAAITVAMAAGNALAGLIIGSAGPAAAFLIAGALCLSGAAFGMLRRRGLQSRD